jgi:hypothetical protein
LASAQATTVPASEVPLPTKPKTDSASDTLKAKPDTMKPAVGRFLDPRTSDQSARTEWNREEMFASGALTLLDLLDHVPEVTTLRSGWISTPQVAAYNGAVNRVRVFLDDVEIDALNGRERGVLDLGSVQLWTLQHVTLERSASELRIYLRTWRVERTTPYTRTDIATGNENTNLYRGYYGKRYDRGQLLQIAGQQYGTSSGRTAGTGDALSLLGRVGIGRNSWSADAYVNRTHVNRSTQTVLPPSNRPAIPPLDATNTIAYLRGGFGHVDAGPWLQIVAATQKFRESSAHTKGPAAAATTTGGTLVPRDTADTTTSSSQIVVGGGLRFGPGRLTLQERMRITEHRRDFGPSARFEVGSGVNVIGAYAESDALRRVTITEASARFQPLSFLAFSAAASHRTGSIEPPGGLSGTALRGSAGIRLRGLWLTGSLITSDTTLRAAAAVYDTSYTPLSIGRSTGVTTSLRGPLWRGIGTDSWITHWSNPAMYQPRYESRTELNYANNFQTRFPTGDFGVKASVAMEYRGRVSFPTSASVVGAGSSRVLSGLLEIRILRAVVTYQHRNILAYQYEIVPGFQMSRVLAIYGVRWEFWN